MDLTIPAGQWRMLGGHTPDEELVIQPVGPLIDLLEPVVPGWVFVSGYREEPGSEVRTWALTLVDQSAIDLPADQDDDFPDHAS